MGHFPQLSPTELVIPGADNNTCQVGGAAYFRRWVEFVRTVIR